MIFTRTYTFYVFNVETYNSTKTIIHRSRDLIDNILLSTKVNIQGTSKPPVGVSTGNGQKLKRGLLDSPLPGATYQILYGKGRLTI